MATYHCKTKYMWTVYTVYTLVSAIDVLIFLSGFHKRLMEMEVSACVSVPPSFRLLSLATFSCRSTANLKVCMRLVGLSRLIYSKKQSHLKRDT